MLRGARLTHKYFSSDEWVTIGDDGEPCSKNPTRTGRIVDITHEAAERLFHSHAPVAYMVHTDFTNIFGESFN